VPAVVKQDSSNDVVGLGAESPPIVTVIAPGAGVDVNSAVYESLRKPGNGSHAAVEVRVKGKKGAPYDVYPSPWPHGRAPPNLQSFAESLADAGDLNHSNCLIFGSRGGQVVLPALWRVFGDSLPPALVINGGCAMSQLPDRGWCLWPEAAVSFLLMGGKDYFRGKFSNEQHLRDAMGSVPKGNSTTAILYIDQMGHTPHNTLLMPILGLLVHSLLDWKGSGKAPVAYFGKILDAVRAQGFTGRFSFKPQAGDDWEETAFTPFGMSRSLARVPARPRAFVAKANRMLAPPTAGWPALLEGVQSAAAPRSAPPAALRGAVSPLADKPYFPPRTNTAALPPTAGPMGLATPPESRTLSCSARRSSPTLLTSAPPASVTFPTLGGGGGYVRTRSPLSAAPPTTASAPTCASPPTACVASPKPEVPKLALNGVTVSSKQLSPAGPPMASISRPPVSPVLVAELEQFNAGFFSNQAKLCSRPSPQRSFLA